MTVRALLHGERFPDSVSITKLELAFNRLLWPSGDERRRTMRQFYSEHANARQAFDAGRLRSS